MPHNTCYVTGTNGPSTSSCLYRTHLSDLTKRIVQEVFIHVFLNLRKQLIGETEVVPKSPVVIYLQVTLQSLGAKIPVV